MIVWPSIMSLAPPPVTPSRNEPPGFGLDDAVPVLVEVAPQAANGPANIAPPTTIPLLISKRRRVIVEARRLFESGLGLSSIASFFLLFVRSSRLMLFQKPRR
jgi:hypothetical protein